jgi:hypothetical protein
MTDKLLDLINAQYPLKPIDTGEFATLKASGMAFTVKAYDAHGLGHVSIMTAKGFLGLMKMDTLMIVPRERDLPLYSYDRIFAAGNDTLIVELYDTLLGEADLGALDTIKSQFAHLVERDPGKHWYDTIKLPQSISKKGKRANRAEFDALTQRHFEAYLAAPVSSVSDKNEKSKRSAAYVNGLLTQGGPSTDVFKKTLGEAATAKLFREVLFGTK